MRRASIGSRFKVQGWRGEPLETGRLKPGTLPVVLIALALVAAWAFATFAPKPPAKPDATWARIVATGEFRVGIDPSFPPFESDDGKGNLTGLDIALANELAQDWSRDLTTTIRVEYVYTGFDGLYDALQAGQFDAIISALPYDARRTEDVRFSHAYFDGGPVVVVPASDTRTQTPYDLARQRVGVELGSTGDAFARRWQRRLQYDVRWYETAADALRALARGEVEGVLTDLIAFNDFARAVGGVRAAGAPLVNEHVVMAVRKDSPTLLERINAVIVAMKQDGRMERLHAQWLVVGE